MPTKKELEQEVSRLELVIAQQSKVVGKLSKKFGVTVNLPWAPHGSNSGHAPYIKPNGSDKDVWRYKVLPIIISVIEKHGTERSHDLGTFTESFLDLHEGFRGGEKSLVIPKEIADMLIDFMNAAADFAREAHAQGIREGSSLLLQLAHNQTTISDYEDRIGREQALDVQAHNRYRRRKY